MKKYSINQKYINIVLFTIVILIIYLIIYSSVNIRNSMDDEQLKENDRSKWEVRKLNWEGRGRGWQMTPFSPTTISWSPAVGLKLQSLWEYAQISHPGSHVWM